MSEILNNQEKALNELRENITDLMKMVYRQLEKANEAMQTFDIELAGEIIAIEKKINATELKIDKECENILALYNPVAIDLRMVLAILNMNTQLERIADHAEGMAHYIVDENIDEAFEGKLLEDLRFMEMFEIAISMVEKAIESFITEDTKMSRWVFGRGIALKKINKKSSRIIADYSKKNPKQVKNYLYLFSTIKKFERIGELSKNIAEETIYFVEAKNIKHQKAKLIAKSVKE